MTQAGERQDTRCRDNAEQEGRRQTEHRSSWEAPRGRAKVTKPAAPRAGPPRVVPAPQPATKYYQVAGSAPTSVQMLYMFLRSFAPGT